MCDTACNLLLQYLHWKFFLSIPFLEYKEFEEAAMNYQPLIPFFVVSDKKVNLHQDLELGYLH